MSSLGLEPTYDTPVGTGYSGNFSSQKEPLAGATSLVPPAQKKVIFFHIFFKAAAVLVYMLSGILLAGSYVFTFVLVTLLSAFDFWTVKNVSGRLLVGLRWWNFIDERGESHWKFESFEDQRFVHPTDSNFFWLGLFLAPLVWLLLGFGAMLTLRFMWFVLVLVAFTCSMINVVGYTKCKKDARSKLSALGGSVLSRGMEMSASLWGARRGGSSGSGSGGGGGSV
eukprot:CAMPEP_0119375406 /NCGR_PEP_ID=MMETSP1334-20130426/35606_1 /TAXON_ID=127549 /ORGANISM="Calcidiscus leptoporus, Strain RCC1130" /LENGTH=224 /DNA_ID=CAMNT_0007393707 /DNA_START=59 /DNA_END=733 /DNA_ORIENTATION=+